MPMARWQNVIMRGTTLLAAQGRNKEVVEVADKSLAYDPANPLNLTDVAHIHLLVRQYEPAVHLRTTHRARGTTHDPVVI